MSSFSENALAAAADQAPEYPRALIVGKVPGDWRVRCDDLGATALHAGGRDLTQARAEEIIAAGFALRVFTINDPDEARKLFDWGVESVFSDFPDRIIGP